MTNDETRMTKEFRNSKHEWPVAMQNRPCSGFRASSFFRHLSFVIRHSGARLIPLVLLLVTSAVTKAASSSETPSSPVNLEFQSLPSADKATPPVLRLRGKDAR